MAGKFAVWSIKFYQWEMSLCCGILLVCILWTQLKISNYYTVLNSVRKCGERQIGKQEQIAIPEIIYQEVTKSFTNTHVFEISCSGRTEEQGTQSLSTSLYLISFSYFAIVPPHQISACYSWWIEKNLHSYLAIINRCLYCQRLFAGILSHSI